jgi:prepilin-type N-terminal cleavage/methylation domain-containing protein
MIKTQRAPSHISHTQGFTLIELLTVIAIIAILAAILIPAVSGVRLQARETAKRSAYRQMFIANNMYAIDNGGMSCLVNERRDGVDHQWYYLLSPYLSKEYNSKWKAREDGIFVDSFYESPDPANKSWTGVGLNAKLRLPDDDTQNAYWTDLNGSEGETLLAAITYPEQRIFLGDIKTGINLTVDLIDTSRHDNKGMFVRFDGSIVLLDTEQATLAIKDPAKLRFGR